MQTDSRIEPAARWVQRALGTTRPVAGRKRDACVIIEMARREGQEISLPVVL